MSKPRHHYALGTPWRAWLRGIAARGGYQATMARLVMSILGKESPGSCQRRADELYALPKTSLNRISKSLHATLCHAIQDLQRSYYNPGGARIVTEDSSLWDTMGNGAHRRKTIKPEDL